MSINLEYYKTFYYVAKYKKISLAAENLYVSQSAVTQTIHKLEEQLGNNLFIRTRSGVELSESGNTLFNLLDENIELLDNIEYRFNKFKNLEKGTIKIRTGSNIAQLILYNALEKFSKDYPNIQIEIATGPVNKSVEMVYNGEIDLVFTYLPFEVEYNNVQVIECAQKEYVFAMSKKYYKENNVTINSINDINNYSVIIPKKGSAIRNIFDDKFKNMITNYHFEIAQEQMKKEFIMRDCGIGFIIKDVIKDELKSGEIIEVDLEESKATGAIGLISLNDKFATFATKELIKYVKNN